MRNFEVFFEIGGKKMRSTVMAESEQAAREEVKNKIKFYKVEKKNDDFNQAVDILDNMKDWIDTLNEKSKS